MIPSLTNTSSSSQSNGAAQSSSSAAASALDPLATEQTFLKLLVAQLQNQDPLEPQDGTQFVAQLAQFSSVEQEVQMRQDLDNINGLLTTQAPQQGGSSQSDQTNKNTQAPSQS